MNIKNIKQFVLRVDLSDHPLGLIEKFEAHSQGVLHRAFSVFIFRHHGFTLQLLLQQRALTKYHSGGLWTNTCCSHFKNPSIAKYYPAKRIKKEMGFSCSMKHAGSFYYKANLGNNMIEHEIDHVFIGFINHNLIFPDSQEVLKYQWIDIDILQKFSEERKEEFTVWFPQAFEIALKFIKKQPNLLV